MVALKGDELELPDQPRWVLLCIARDPRARLRDIAASLGTTERRAHAVVTGLAAAGYVVKQKDDRRKPLPGPGPR